MDLFLFHTTDRQHAPGAEAFYRNNGHVVWTQASIRFSLDEALAQLNVCGARYAGFILKIHLNCEKLQTLLQGHELAPDSVLICVPDPEIPLGTISYVVVKEIHI